MEKYIVTGTLCTAGHQYITIAPIVQYTNGQKSGSFINEKSRLQREVTSLDRFPIGAYIELTLKL